MSKKVGIFHTISGLFFLLILSVAYFNNWFVIKEIRCTVDDASCSPEMFSQFQVLLGKQYFFTDFLKKTTSLIDSSLYTVESVKKESLGVIHISLSQIGSRYHLLYESGELLTVYPTGELKQEPASGLPTIAMIGNSSSSSLPPQLHLALSSALVELSRAQLKWQTIKVVSQEKILIELETGQRVIIDTSDSSSRLQVLPQLLVQDSIQELDPPVKEIDLRFNLPVLRTELSGD